MSIYDRKLLTGLSVGSIVQKATSKQMVPYWFILPFLTGFFIFYGWPLIWAPWMSLHEFSFTGSTWVGLENYASLLNEETFRQSLLNTFILGFLKVPVDIVFGLVAAVVVNSAYIRYKKVWRTIYLSPLIVSGVIIAYITLIFFTHNGMIDLFMQQHFGFTIGWTTDKWPSRLTVVMADVLNGAAQSFLFFLAGLAGISDHLYDAAKIDGANRLQQFRYVTLPQLKPMLLLVIILRTNGAMKMFAIPHQLSNPANKDYLSVIIMKLYNETFVSASLGRGAAVGVIVTVIVAVIVIIEYVVGEDDD